ncbi:MAG: type II secretion system protein [Gammaproteobacteria bacterium]
MKYLPIANRYRIKGFTIIELLIVVVILGILAAIAIPEFTSSTDEAKDGSLKSTLQRMRTAISLYQQQHGAYPGVNKTAASATDAATAAAFRKQLTHYTDKNGIISTTKDTTYKYGPYIKVRNPANDFPINPVDDDATIEYSTAGLGMTATANSSGWKYSAATGEIIANITAKETF